MTIGQAWRAVRDVFRRGGIENAELDARLLAELAFGLNKLELVTRERDEAWKEALEKMQALAARRIRGEPVVRILGEKEFFGLPFKLNAATLVPRPETEMLVSKALQLIEGKKKAKILDLGTGTGCIGISILAATPVATVVAVDLAEQAIAMANANAETHGVKKRFDARVGSWFEPLKPREEFDVIVSNPPYIASKAIDTLAREVKDHDPRVALDGGIDGLDAYRAILSDAGKWLKSDGTLVVEVGFDQGRPVRALFENAGLAEVVIERDLEGLDRMVVGTHF
jgi:release factor glutamine methyltransferase